MSDKIRKTDQQWREQLSAEQFAVTRQGGTERAFTGKYWDTKTKRTYKCVCCGYYNIHANPELNHHLHEDKLDTVRRAGARGMAVECVTCWEAFDPAFRKAGVPLWDLMVAAEQATRPRGTTAGQTEVSNGR